MRKWKAFMKPEDRTSTGEPKPTLKDSVVLLEEELALARARIKELEEEVSLLREREKQREAGKKAKVLAWKATRTWDNRETFRAEVGRGCYDIYPATSGGKSRYYVLRHFVAGKERSIGPVKIKDVDEAKALAQRDHEEGGADEAEHPIDAI